MNFLTSSVVLSARGCYKLNATRRCQKHACLPLEYNLTLMNAVHPAPMMKDLRPLATMMNLLGGG